MKIENKQYLLHVAKKLSAKDQKVLSDSKDFGNIPYIYSNTELCAYDCLKYYPKTATGCWKYVLMVLSSDCKRIFLYYCRGEKTDVTFQFCIEKIDNVEANLTIMLEYAGNQDRTSQINQAYVEYTEKLVCDQMYEELFEEVRKLNTAISDALQSLKDMIAPGTNLFIYSSRFGVGEQKSLLYGIQQICGEYPMPVAREIKFADLNGHICFPKQIMTPPIAVFGGNNMPLMAFLGKGQNFLVPLVDETLSSVFWGNVKWSDLVNGDKEFYDMELGGVKMLHVNISILIDGYQNIFLYAKSTSRLRSVLAFDAHRCFDEDLRKHEEAVVENCGGSSNSVKNVERKQPIDISNNKDNSKVDCSQKTNQDKAPQEITNDSNPDIIKSQRIKILMKLMEGCPIGKYKIIRTKHGDVVKSYKELFFDYFGNATELTMTENYVSEDYQLANLKNFLEQAAKRGVKKINLTVINPASKTNSVKNNKKLKDTSKEVKALKLDEKIIENDLEGHKLRLMKYDAELHYDIVPYTDGHARNMQLNNGIIITSDRGVDVYFYKNKNRMQRACTITIFVPNTVFE